MLIVAIFLPSSPFSPRSLIKQILPIVVSAVEKIRHCFPLISSGRIHLRLFSSYPASMFLSSLRLTTGHLLAASHLRYAAAASPLSTQLSHLLQLRGGSSEATAAAETKYVTLDSPAPGSRKFAMMRCAQILRFIHPLCVIN
jgi:hypothetical protein